MYQDVYAAIAELLCNPAESESDERSESVTSALALLCREDPEGAALLSRFLAEPVSEEQYNDLFEVDPQCALYLGAHVFDEPKNCCNAGVCDRNKYMLDLGGIYGHLGFSPNGKELPDYLPLMVEMLALTAGSKDPIRRKLIEEHMRPHLPPLRNKVAKSGAPHVHLLDLLDRALASDLEGHTADHMEASHG